MAFGKIETGRRLVVFKLFLWYLLLSILMWPLKRKTLNTVIVSIQSNILKLRLKISPFSLSFFILQVFFTDLNEPNAWFMRYSNDNFKCSSNVSRITTYSIVISAHLLWILNCGSGCASGICFLWLAGSFLDMDLTPDLSSTVYDFFDNKKLVF